METELLRKELSNRSCENQSYKTGYAALISSNYKKESPGLESLLKTFNDLPDFDNSGNQREYTAICIDKLKQVKYEARDAIEMCENFVPYNNKNGFGIFASAALFYSIGDDAETTIRLKRAIPYFLSGELFVDEILKRPYRKHKITVDGNIGDYSLSYANGLEAAITGYAGNHVCYEMRNGCIKIGKDAGNYLGENMIDGEIDVEGKAGIEIYRNTETIRKNNGLKGIPVVHCKKGFISAGSDSAPFLFIKRTSIHNTLFNVAHAYQHFRDYGPGNKYLNFVGYSLLAADAIALASYFLGIDNGSIATMRDLILNTSVFQLFFCYWPVARQLNKFFGRIVNERKKDHDAKLSRVLDY